MKKILVLVLAFSALASSVRAEEVAVFRNVECPHGSGWAGRIDWATATLYVADWRVLADESVLLRVGETGRDAAFSKCGAGIDVVIEVLSKGFDKLSVTNEQRIAFAKWRPSSGWDRAYGHPWLEYYAGAVRSLVEGEKRQRAAEIEHENKLHAVEKQKSAALADCGAEPVVSGGPWFSSTYKVAARDAARHGFLCVKTIEYISAAPNPFGGNAARARFVGYQARYEPQRGAFGLPIGQEVSTYELTSEVRDFPY